MWGILPGQDPGKQSVQSTPSSHHNGLPATLSCTQNKSKPQNEGGKNGGNTHSLTHSLTQGRQRKLSWSHPLISSPWGSHKYFFYRSMKKNFEAFNSDTKLPPPWSPATVARKNVKSFIRQWLKSVTAVHVIQSHVEVPLPPRNSAKPSDGILLGHLRCTCTWGVGMPSYFPAGHSLLGELWKKESSIIPCTTALCLSPDSVLSTSEGQNTKD